MFRLFVRLMVRLGSITAAEVEDSRVAFSTGDAEECIAGVEPTALADSER
jgi:hypothetical protein